MNQAYWLSDREVELAERKMSGTYLGSWPLRDEETGELLGHEPVDVFFTTKWKYPFVGVYREDGQVYATDAESVFLPHLDWMITVVER